jgi:hypothetical protein
MKKETEKLIENEIKKLKILMEKTRTMEDESFVRGKISGVRRAVKILRKELTND